MTATVLLCVGRIDPQKNQLDLIRALPEWKRMNPSVHLVLVGHVTNEEYESRIRTEIRQSNLQDNVTIIPGIDPQSSDLPNAYHAADLFVLPSLHEPFGIVVVEAWAAGLPVVASRVGGLADLIVDGQDGYLFDVRDRHDLTSTVSRVLKTSAAELAPMVSRARNKAETEYSWDRVTEQLLEIYSEVSSDLSYSK